MEQKKSRWHKIRVDGTKSESVEQNQSRPGIFKESVPYHPVQRGQVYFENKTLTYLEVSLNFLICSINF